MPRYDFTSQRLYFDCDLSERFKLELDRNQANYLLNVLRLKSGGHVLLFNGRDGEWHADLEQEGRKKAHLIVSHQTRPQTPLSDLHYLFAPLKQARMEYMVQKAVEMGVSRLQPVFTDFTQMRKVNLEKMRVQAIEAAEQCGILNLPEIDTPKPLFEVVNQIPTERHILFCDEGEESQNPLSALNHLTPAPISLLIGPEGGFSEQEREMLRKNSSVTPIPLGPRVLRADTAAVAALAVIQATLGDWQDEG